MKALLHNKKGALLLDAGLCLLVAAGVVLANALAADRKLEFVESSVVLAEEHSLAMRRWEPNVIAPSTGAVIVSGRVRNTAGAPSGLVRVRVTLLDASGVPIGTAVGFPPEWTLRPGRVATFVAPAPPDPRVAGYVLRVEEARA